MYCYYRYCVVSVSGEIVLKRTKNLSGIFFVLVNYRKLCLSVATCKTQCCIIFVVLNSKSAPRNTSQHAYDSSYNGSSQVDQSRFVWFVMQNVPISHIFRGSVASHSRPTFQAWSWPPPTASHVSVVDRPPLWRGGPPLYTISYSSVLNPYLYVPVLTVDLTSPLPTTVLSCSSFDSLSPWLASFISGF